jgi:hypothetical protein
MPTQYFEHGLNLSEGQIKSLAEGKTVRLTVDKLSGPHIVHLTRTQINKIAKCSGEGKGCDLKLSAVQLRHQRMVGSGILSDLWNGIKKVASYGYQNIAKPALSKTYHRGIKILENEVVPRLQTRANQLGDQAVGYANNRINTGLRKIGAGQRRRQQKGEGLFDDVVSGLSSIAKVALPIATNVGTNILMKRFGGGVDGQGIYPPGQRI